MSQNQNKIQQNTSKARDEVLPVKKKNRGKIFLKISVLFVTIAIVLLSICIALLSFFAWSELNSFASDAKTTPESLITTAQSAWNHSPKETNNKKNFLILGLDTLENRGSVPALTDTVMILSVDLYSGKISTVSLPRDLWSDEYQTKINALYHYGQDRYPNEPERFTKEVIESMTGVPIHHTIVITLDQLETLIDLAGGVDVTIKNGFIDSQFPRTDVDVTSEHDPAKLYETIEFLEGTEHMSGKRALKYIRSRHSTDDQGTDDARSIRQQDVIKSLALSLIDYEKILADRSIPAHLYEYYMSTFDSQFSLIELLSSFKILYSLKDQIEYNPGSLSISDSDSEGSLFHPTPSKKYQNQWVYAVVDSDSFKQEVQKKLD